MATESPIAVIKRQKMRSGKGWGVSVEADALDVLPSPVLAVAMVSEAVIAHHRDRIIAGQKADGSGPQVALDPSGTQGALADSGARPDVRGHTKKAYFPNKLRRTKIRTSRKPVRFGKGHIGIRAACEIKPPPIGNWLDKEAERGVEYFYTGGDVDKVVDAAIARYVEAITGGPVEVDDGEKDADQITLVRPWNH